MNPSRFKHSRNRFHAAFTFVELLIVITILAVLAGVALVDYGVSIKKARLQVATEELMNFFSQAQVYSQTRYSQTDPDTGDEEVVCWAVVVSDSESPTLVQVLWDETSEACSSDVGHWEAMDALVWYDWTSITRLEWKTYSSTGQVGQGSETSLALVFSPPEGDLALYLNPDSQPAALSDVTGVEIQIAYGGDEEDIFNKTIRVTPVTGSFVVLPGDGSQQ